MKQILQNLNSGETILADVPSPSISSKSLLIHTTKSLVSAGTERMLVDFGRGNLVQKARQQPDKVKQVLDKVKTDGLVPTLDAVRNKLDTPLPLGYCNVGIVAAIGAGVIGFEVGDRVLSNGKHAEVVAVPKNLCAKIPDSVDDESAAFTVIGAIALQGIRLVKPTIGETIVVTGLGLIGLLAVQLLRANGCRVLGLDFDESKLNLAEQFGAQVIRLNKDEDPIIAADRYTKGRGVDAVLITASTKSNEPIHQAATMCRKRGRIVLVGVVGMQVSRADFYEKELSFQVSCSYGPGRYDPEYEDRGHDYPIGFVRWTEQRNFEAVLDMMADGLIDVKHLASHRFPLSDAAAAYDLVSEGTTLGVLLEYPQSNRREKEISTITLGRLSSAPASKACLGFIGAGNYASAVLVPAFAKTSARLVSIASATGVSSMHVGKKYGIEQATTDTESLVSDVDINALVVTTRHDSHAKLVLDGLKKNKHVFVEKPLALNRDELAEISKTYRAMGDSAPHLMVGFNRRYSPFVQTVKRLLSSGRSPLSLIMTVNAGAIPADHWTQNLAVGGGRIVGECCHFIDLLRFVAGASIVGVNAVALDTRCKDSVMINLKFSNGSIGVVSYLANGSKSFPKERLEVFSDGGILQLDNFKTLKGYGWPGFNKQSGWRQDKGQANCVTAFVDAIHTGDRDRLIPFNELVEVANTCFEIVDQLGS